MSEQPDRVDPEIERRIADDLRSVAKFATVMLIFWALCVWSQLFQFLAWGECLLGIDDSPACLDWIPGQQRADNALRFGALLGVLVAFVGCWYWPGRWKRVWLTIGYLLAVVGLVIAMA